MALTIQLPQVGESVVEGTIGKWLKQPGDRVDRFEPLVEVITDKVTMEIPSPVQGSLIRVLVKEGDIVPMGAPIAEMETDALLADTPNTSAPEAVAPHSPSTISYLVKDARPVGPTGGGVAEDSAEVEPAPISQAPREAARPSPAVRRLAQEYGIELTLVHGTGAGGRITREDLLKHIESRDSGVAEEYLPLTPVRRMIAEAMVRSVNQIPHAWSTVEVDVTGLVTLRNSIRAGFEQKEGVELTCLPFIIKAVAESLKEHPTLNASWGDDKIILKKRINLGIAVAAPLGLTVPVIHDADLRSIADLAHALSDLATRARQNKLTLADVQGGTFTLNNTGALGSIVSQPIINYPQAAILTAEAIQQRPAVHNDVIAIRSMMNLCISFDHRINDGAEVSAFVDAVKRRLEAIGPDTPIQ